MNHLPYQAMIEQMTDSAIYADKQGIIRVWNKASENLFGFTREEALGQSLDIIIPEHLRAPHWRGFHAAIAAGKTKHGGKATRTKALHKNGGFIYAEISFCVITDAASGERGSLSTARPAPPKEKN
ncbi:PAS domain-containing protein [Neisseria wadsworthii]|uniref:PAS domain-containing protein n=1 Tax=Neisseria wadsworthii TaxID=607711 RepID=UPI000D304227|nr:PAS domain-containing protein [Neisseria wadsworthii]